LLDGGLCVEEPAWKLDVEFIRTKNFPEKELWTVRGSSMPSPMEATKVDMATNVNGVPLRFVRISGVDCPTPALRASLPNQPVAHVVCTSMPEGAKLVLARAIDQEGRDIASGWSMHEGRHYLFGLKMREGTKAVDLTFAVTRRVPVTYYVKPTRITAAELEKAR
jgi:hypothetical protein